MSGLFPFLPILWALLAIAVWWRNLSSPWLFFIVGLLAIFGIQTVLSFACDLLPVSGTYFIEGAHTAAQVIRAMEEHEHLELKKAVILPIISFPLLWWFKKGLSAAQKP